MHKAKRKGEKRKEKGGEEESIERKGKRLQQISI